MSKVNQVPVGLQAFLGSKNLGRNPDELLNEIRPVVDIFPFLSGYQQTSSNSSGTANTDNFSLTVTVPDGEIWLPIQVQGSSRAQNTCTWVHRLFAQNMPNMLGTMEMGTAPDSGTFTFTDADFLYSTYWQNPGLKIIFLPGTDFVFQTNRTVGSNNLDVFLTVQYLRLDY